MRLCVELDGVSGAHVHRAYAESHLGGSIDTVEIDQPLERGLQGCNIVVADRVGALRRPQNGRRKAGLEETGRTKKHNAQRAHLVDHAMGKIVFDFN